MITIDIIMMVGISLVLGSLIGYELGNAKGFTDGYEVGRKYNKED